MNRRTLALVCCGLLSACGCNPLTIKLASMGGPATKGSGVPTTEKLELEGPVTSIEIQSVIDATVTVGGELSGQLTGDDNIVPLIETVIVNETLIVRPKGNQSIEPKTPLKLVLTVPTLRGATAMGVSTIRVEGAIVGEEFTANSLGASAVIAKGLNVRKLTAQASGSSKALLAGSAGAATVGASGASQVEAGTLTVEDANVDCSGASGVEIRAAQSVAGTVSGASRARIHGKPARRSISTSGASTVEFGAD